GEQKRTNRLYAVESTPRMTGATADHRLPLRASEMEHFARGVAARLGIEGVGAGGPETQGKWKLSALVEDLRQHRGRSVILAGDGQPAVVHALAHAMNQALDNFGKTVVLTHPLETDPLDGKPFVASSTLEELVTDMEEGTVDLLVV